MLKYVRAAGALWVCMVVAGCDSMHESPDFYRHSMSQLSVPRMGGDFLWYDVKVSPEMPADNSQAEAQRIAWLEGWLQVRKLCLNGYEILERRPFDFLEDNPGRYDLRYKVQCTVAPPPA